MPSAISATTEASAPYSTMDSSVSGLSTEEQMLALIVYTQVSQMGEAKTSINLNAEQLEKLREQVREALEKAMEAEKDSGFWGGLAKLFGGDLASIASAIAAVAVAIGSGGAAVAILAVVATAVSLAAEHAEDLGIPAEVAMAIAVAASVAALCCGDGKGLFEVSQKVRDICRDVKTYASAAALTFKAEGAVYGGVAAGYERAAKYEQANARLADGRQDLVMVDMDEAFARLSAAFDQCNAAVERTSAIQQQSAASGYAMLTNWGGAA
jgi:hypothetical protein